MKIAVTGGSGFLGQYVTQALVAEGHDVRILDVVAPASSGAVTYDPEKVEYVYEDLENPYSVAQGFKDCQVVMHLAAVSNTRRAYDDPEQCMLVNSLGTQNVYQAARDAGVQRVVLAGSSLVSGALADPDDYPGVYHEDLPLLIDKVTHPYVMSKVHGEMIANVWMMQYSVETTVFRYGIQYGRNMAPGVVVQAFISKALNGEKLQVNGSGDQWRQYIHVSDIARAHALLVAEKEQNPRGELPEETLGTFNIVGNDKVSINDLAEAVAAQTGAEIVHGDARGDDIAVQMLSNEKVKNMLGWEPTVSLEEGLKDAIDWYRKKYKSGR